MHLSIYVKYQEYTCKQKACKTIPAEFTKCFTKVHRLLKEAKLFDCPLASYKCTRASYKTDIESYLKKSGSPIKHLHIIPAPA